MHISNLFQNLLFVLDSGCSQLKNKTKLKKSITSAGGTISYIINKKVCYVVIPDDDCDDIVDSYRLRQARKFDIPIVKESFVYNSIEKRRLLDVKKYLAGPSEKDVKFRQGKIAVTGWNSDQQKKKTFSSLRNFKSLPKFAYQNETSTKFSKTYNIVKFAILKGSNADQNGLVTDSYSVLELHLASPNNNSNSCVRILEQNLSNEENKSCFEYFSDCIDEALWFMQQLVDQLISKQKMEIINYLPANNQIGSVKLRRMLDEIGAAAGNLHPQVARIINGIAKLGFDEILKNISKHDILQITSDEIIKATVALVKAKSALKHNEQTREFAIQFSQALHLKRNSILSNMKQLSQAHDFLQLVKDSLLLSESRKEFSSVFDDDGDLGNRISSYYRMLKCSISVLEKDDADHQLVMDLLTTSSKPEGFVIKNIFRVHRDIEDSRFSHSITPSKLLFHASDPKNFVGILSRGLLTPFVVVNEHGGERSDVGMLGGAIYFTDNISKAGSYSKPNPITGGRLMLIHEVALGECYDVNNHTPDLTGPPEGYNSVRGVGRREDVESDFDADEYGIYNVEQQRMRFLVEFTVEGDYFNESSLNPCPLMIPTPLPSLEEVDMTDVENVKDPMDKEKFGLLPSESDSQFCAILKEIHIRSKLKDMSAEVIVMQVYSNLSARSVEAKYVFPLDGAASVCGFEAFINNKHVIGKVKEKEVARKEYKAAIDAGHGAYLMDQEKADVFTINVGNLPPRATVLIKITYVCELDVVAADDGSSDSIVLRIPGRVTPHITQAALLSGPITQTKVDTVTTGGSKLSRYSFMASIEMPYDIRQITSTTHKIHVKRSATKAFVKMARGETPGPSGLELSVTMAEIHVPRMWMEEHPQKSGSYASMLAFYPEFESNPISNYKAVLLIDVSQSMGSNPGEKLDLFSKKLALMILKALPPSCVVNVIRFGSTHEELFICEQLLGENVVREKATHFIQSSTATHGASELWRPLHTLELLQRSSVVDRITNVFLISDGHLSEEKRLMDLSQSLGQSGPSRSMRLTRIFTFSIGSSANQHLLREMSHSSGGAHEHFSMDSKSRWQQKVDNQLCKAQQPVLNDIEITWSADKSLCDVTTPLPSRAPETIKTFFNNSRLVVYSFVPYCTMATLCAKIGDHVINTVASTSDLNIKKGNMLHKLAARAFIKDYEEGLHDVDPLERDALKIKRKPSIISLSCEHGVMSQYTSFVAVEEREEGEDSVSEEAPPVSDLIDKVITDPIPEIQWSEDVIEEELPDLERVSNKIRAAELASMTSVADAKRRFSEIDEVLVSMDGAEKIEAMLQVLNSQLKLQINEDCRSRSFVASFTRLLRSHRNEISSDRQKLSNHLSLMCDITSRMPCDTLESIRWKRVVRRFISTFENFTSTYKLSIDELQDYVIDRDSPPESICFSTCSIRSQTRLTPEKCDVTAGDFFNMMRRPIQFESQQMDEIDGQFDSFRVSGKSSLARQRTMMSTRSKRKDVPDSSPTYAPTSPSSSSPSINTKESLARKMKVRHRSRNSQLSTAEKSLQPRAKGRTVTLMDSEISNAAEVQFSPPLLKESVSAEPTLISAMPAPSSVSTATGFSYSSNDKVLQQDSIQFSDQPLVSSSPHLMSNKSFSSSVSEGNKILSRSIPERHPLPFSSRIPFSPTSVGFGGTPPPPPPPPGCGRPPSPPTPASFVRLTLPPGCGRPPPPTQTGLRGPPPPPPPPSRGGIPSPLPTPASFVGPPPPPLPRHTGTPSSLHTNEAIPQAENFSFRNKKPSPVAKSSLFGASRVMSRDNLLEQTQSGGERLKKSKKSIVSTSSNTERNVAPTYKSNSVRFDSATSNVAQDQDLFGADKLFGLSVQSKVCSFAAPASAWQLMDVSLQSNIESDFTPRCAGKKSAAVPVQSMFKDVDDKSTKYDDFDEDSYSDDFEEECMDVYMDCDMVAYEEAPTLASMSSCTSCESVSDEEFNLADDKNLHLNGFQRFRDVFLELLQVSKKKEKADTKFKNYFEAIVIGGKFITLDKIYPRAKFVNSHDVIDSLMDKVLIEAGARSLGVTLLNVSGAMLIVAIGIGLIEELHLCCSPALFGSALASLQSWLKEMDARFPSLYFRLQLGNSWNQAARSVFDRLLNLWLELGEGKVLFIMMLVNKFVFYIRALPLESYRPLPIS